MEEEKTQATQEEEATTKDNFHIVEFDSDEKALVDSMGLGFDEKTRKITIDIDGLRKGIERIRTKDQEFLSVENELTGLKVTAGSHSLSFEKLRQSVHDTILFSQVQTPCKVPCGVD